MVITGGASAAIETIRDYQARMRGHLIELYGMLETGFHTYTRFTDDPQKVNGTIGRVVSSMELRFSTRPATRSPHGEVGEIAARGPSVHLGYHNNPSANAEAFTADGWFRTGDLGRFVDGERNVADRRAAQGDHQSRRQEVLSRARSRRSSTPTPRSCTPPWSASPTRGWASATACA